MANESDRIVPSLSTFDTAMVVVSLVIGVGIFRTPSIVARHTPGPAIFLLVWAAGAAVSLAGALTFAEIGSRHARAGGYYRVVADCYHPMLAFMLNWGTAIMLGAGTAGVAFLGAEYLAPFVPWPGSLAPFGVRIVAFALMLGLLATNAAGIRAGSRVQDALSLAKIALIALAAASALLPRPAAPAATFPLPARLHPLAALIPVIYAFGGYQMSMNLGADVRDANRKFPRAIVAGMLIVAALYLSINLAYVRALTLPGVAGASLVAAALARATVGAAGERIVSVAIFLSTAGFVNAAILQMPRTYYAMSADRVLPAAFRRVEPRTGVQPAGLAFFAVTMLVPGFFLGSFEKLLDYVMFTDSLTIAIVASSVFVLRRRADSPRNTFRMPGYPVLPAAFVAILLALVVQLAITETRLSLAGTIVILSGAPIFAVGRRVSSRASSVR